MKALISPLENNRIAEVALNAFPVAEPMFWVDCSDNVAAEWTYQNGEFFAPVVPGPVIPNIVTMRQARLALLQFELLDTVNAVIASGNEADKITWEYATDVRRDDALVVNMAAALNLTEGYLNNLFITAAAL